MSKDIIPLLLAAIYIRVSSEMQLDGHSLESQERICREWCERHGYTVVQVYRDEAKSASTNDRPEFQRMIAGAQAGAFTAIVYYHTWRFSRNTEDGSLMKRLEAQGVALVSVSEGINSKTASGKLQRNMTLAIGEYQLDQLRDATRTGKQERIRGGSSNASKPPFGYKRVFEVLDAATKSIIGRDLQSDDADTVRQMFEMYATGNYSAMDLAEWLNAQGKKTTGVWGNRAFGKDTVQAMLRNAFYAGWVSYRGLSDRKSVDGKRHLYNPKQDVKWTQGTHQPIISMELFEQCQQMRAKRFRSNLQGRKPAKQRVFLFAKMAYCSKCGGRLRGARWGKPGTKNEQNAYRCTAAERACECGATYRVVPEAFLMPALNDIMASVTLPEDVRAEAVSLLQGMDTTGATDKQRDKLEGELKRVNRMYQAGNLADDEYDRETARLKAEMALLARSANMTETIDVQAAIAVLDDMAALWTEATQQEKADIVRSLFDAFNVDLDERKLHSFKPKTKYAALVRAAYTKTEVTGFEAAPDVKIGSTDRGRLFDREVAFQVQCIVLQGDWS